MIERPNPSTSIDKTAKTGPSHHPTDELLLDHAIRACLPAEALVIDLHLEFCGRCRRIASDLVAIGGAMLDAIEPAFVSPQMFNKTLQAIGHGGQKTQAEQSPVPSIPAFAARWPAPLRDRVAAGRLKRWRWMPGGFRALRIPFAEPDARLWIMKARGGRGTLAHTHISGEWTLVLEGGFTDETGRYEAGDFISAGPGQRPRTVAEPREGCVCALLVRDPLVYTTWAGKLLAPFIQV